MVKLCPWDLHRCFLSSCGSVLSGSTEVVVCYRHRNPSGYCMPRKVVGFHLSIFDLWAGKRLREVVSP